MVNFGTEYKTLTPVTKTTKMTSDSVQHNRSIMNDAQTQTHALQSIINEVYLLCTHAAETELLWSTQENDFDLASGFCREKSDC